MLLSTLRLLVCVQSSQLLVALAVLDPHNACFGRLWEQGEEQMGAKDYNGCVATMQRALALEPENRRFIEEEDEARLAATQDDSKGMALREVVRDLEQVRRLLSD